MSTRKVKPVKSPPSKKQDVLDMEALRNYVRNNSARFLNDPNITSVGIGYKIKDGQRSGELAIQFTVGCKVQPEDVKRLNSQPIPNSINVGGKDIPTDVLERSFKASYVKVTLEGKDQRKVRLDPLIPGVSIGNPTTSAGTIGCFVRERQSKRTVLLSNWHVLHGTSGSIGIDIVQPGKADDNRIDQNIIGKLIRSFVGPAGDCAIASVVSRRITTKILELTSAVSAIGDPEIGDLVIKSGRTSGVTRGRVARLEVNTKIAYSANFSENVGGFEIEPDPNALPDDGQISRGGDSGSVWMACDAKGNAKGVMLGLHFAGDVTGGEIALACYAKSVMTKLDIEPLGPEEQSLAAEAIMLPLGFDRDFLNFGVGFPKFSGKVAKDLVDLDGDIELAYCHFSVWLSKERKYPRCVAWNIDGNNLKRVPRTGFRMDQRGGLDEFQLSDKTYIRNSLDKGHIARRADVCWGSKQEAQQANYDSSYYTNIAPQHEAFNQSTKENGDGNGGLWGCLENTLLDTEKPHGMRVSLIAGPIFGKNDRGFIQNGETCLLPDEFWKIVAYVDDTTAEEKVYAFLLSQRYLLDPLVGPESLDLDQWMWARISLRDLQSMTGLKFGKSLHDRESPFTTTQSLSDRPPVKIISNTAELFS